METKVEAGQGEHVRFGRLGLGTRRLVSAS